MTPPALANVFAVTSADADVLERVARRLQEATDPFDLAQPGRSWVVATQGVAAGLQSSSSVTPFFTEGGDLLKTEEALALGDAATTTPASLARRAGDFGFLHVGNDDEAVFVRSCGGRVPVYVRDFGVGVAVSTRLSDLIRFVPADFELDAFVCALWGSGWGLFPDGRTFFRDTWAVGRGQVVRIARGGRAVAETYWDPRPSTLARPTEERRREHADRFRAHLLDSLRRELDPDGVNLLTLSGGVDSSSLAAVAAGTLGARVSTVSFIPPVEPNRSTEMGYIENLRRHFPFEDTWEFPIDYAGRVDAVVSAPSVAFPVVHPALGILPRILEQKRVEVLFGGEFADEVAGAAFTIPDWIRHTSPLALLRGMRELPKGPRTIPRWVKHRLVRAPARRPYLFYSEELPDFVVAEVREEYREWRLDQTRRVANDRRPLRYLALQAQDDAFIAMNWEVTSSLGVRRAWPFFTREILELAFECHPSELVGPGSKKLLRAALANDVPRFNLDRPDRGHWRDPVVVGRLPKRQPLTRMPDVFDERRLADGETEFGIPLSWLFNRFLDAIDDLRAGKRPG